MHGALCLKDHQGIILSDETRWRQIISEDRSNFFQLVCRTCRAIHTYFEFKYDHALDIHDN